LRLALFGRFNELDEAFNLGLGLLVEAAIPLLRCELQAEIPFDGEKALPAHEHARTGKIPAFMFAVCEVDFAPQPGASQLQVVKVFHFYTR
jgi:hypothetical protein